MKDFILQALSMEDIINRYNLKHYKRKMSCPFHGTDKHPSAQIYDKYFHCFTCGKHLDIIGFVQEYYNLDFKEAMQKINIDFNLGLDIKAKINYEKIQQIQENKKQNEKLFNSLQKKFCSLCDKKFEYLQKINNIKSKLNINNWDLLTLAESKYRDKIEIIETELDFLINEMYEFKRTRI